jgi:ABC-type Na+ efflux pump permease subunit
MGQGQSLGEALVQILDIEGLTSLLDISLAPDAAAARGAVDRQEAAVAVIIPPDFSAAFTSPGRSISVELYQDPTLMLGPGIVHSILSQVMDGFSGVTIGISVTAEQMASAGLPVDTAAMQSLAAQFVSAASGIGAGPSQEPLLQVQNPQGLEDTGSPILQAISLVFSGMMVFFAFFTGAASAQSILREEESGTLPRLFTTPTRLGAILGGKTLAVLLLLLVQMTILMVFGSRVFGIYWGETGAVIPIALGIVLTSASLGFFLVSFMTTSRQAGVIFGGVLTITGMLGIISVFTFNLSGGGGPLDTAALIVPQGWGMQGLILAMDGQPARAVLPYLAGMLAWSLVLAVVAFRRLRVRFA